LGALGGALLKIDLRGIEFTMTALFIVIFIEQWISAAKTTRAPAVIGLLCGLVSRLILGPDRFILPALVVTVTTLLALRPILDRKANEKGEKGL
jgi:4-azaleucine resistance transporter AzlC